MLCSSCGKYLLPPDKFCPYCGCKLTVHFLILRCSKGHIVDARHEFCKECGEALIEHPPKPWPRWKWFLRGMPS